MTDDVVIYEVTVTAASEIAAAFEQYLIETHIPDLLATGCFISAEFLRAEEGRYRTRYEAADRDNLENYLHHHASALRHDVLVKFPSGLSFDREEWQVLGRFNSR